MIQYWQRFYQVHLSQSVILILKNRGKGENYKRLGKDLILQKFKEGSLD